MYNRLLVTALAALMFTTQADAQRQRSEALEITRATALKGALRDVPREDIEEALRGSPDMSINYALDALGVATGVFDQATSLSRLGEAGVFAALAFLGGTAEYDTRTALFAWMPREDAPTPRDAGQVLEEILLNAVQRSLPEYSVEVGPTPNGYHTIYITGNGCRPCTFDSQLWGNIRPGKTRAPAVLGRYLAYRWGGSQAFGTIGGYPLINGLTLEERLVFFRTLSSHLPAWAYIYLPPHDMLLEFPLMFNEGEPLYFIEPAAAENG